MSRARLCKRIARLRSLLPDEPIVLDASAGLPLGSDHLDSLRKMGFRKGDVLLGLDTGGDKHLHLAEALDAASQNLDNPDHSSFTWLTRRGDQVIPVEVRIIEPEIVRHEIRFPEWMARPVLEAALGSLATLDDTITGMHRRMADRSDLPVVGEGMDGMWNGHYTATTPEEERVQELIMGFLLQMGMQLWDRVEYVNGHALNSPTVLMTIMEEAREALDRGEPFTFALDIERGAFHRVQLELQIR
jgi:hypothetical protein